ncbi:MAG: DUF1614 domain-containing protein [Desulfobacterales bacterium]|jgi:uncharacterized membrane protein
MLHYFPLTLPFLLILFFLFIFLVIMVEVGILGYAYQTIGINRRYIFLLLLMCFWGSYINIPIYRLPPEIIRSAGQVTFFGIPYVIPTVTQWPGTVIAVNVGGAVIPTILCIYLIFKNQLFSTALIGVAVVSVIVHWLAYPVPGVGIAEPVLVPLVTAAIVAMLLSMRYAPALAYISGTLGTLIGADLLNLAKIQGLGAPIASIGGAGTFDGIFTTGILAVLLAGLITRKSTFA